MLWSLWALCPPQRQQSACFVRLWWSSFWWACCSLFESAGRKKGCYTLKAILQVRGSGRNSIFERTNLCKLCTLAIWAFTQRCFEAKSFVNIKGKEDWQGCLALRVVGRAQLITGSAFLTLVLESCTLGEQILFTLMSHKLPLYSPVRLSLCELSSLCLPIGRHASVLRQPWLTGGSAAKTPHLGIGLQRSVWWPYRDLRERTVGLEMPKLFIIFII